MSVRVPATSANLGPGFDSAGLALDLHDDVVVALAPAGLEVHVEGESAGELEPGQRVVCTVTGNGLKDPEWAISGAPAPVTVPVDAAVAAAQLGL